MTTPHSTSSGRMLRAITLSTSALLATQSAHAQIAKYTLATTQVGISFESVTADGYPNQNNRMAGGACVADFNNDTYPDIFVPSLGTYPNKLYINNQDGTFSEQAEQWGIADIHLGMGTTAADINNDGYPEIYTVSLGEPGIDNARPGACLLYLNSGPDANNNFAFTDIAEAAGVNDIFGIPGGMTPAFGDIDLDGDLDLFVATWRAHEGGNRLFENQYMQTGTNTFVDITAESMSAPDREPIIRGFTPHIVDVTGDRYPEILLSADYETSEIFVNNGVNKDGRATFRTTTNKSNINADFNAMGAAIADFNRDGLLDWFQTNIYLPNIQKGNTLYMGMSVDSMGDPIFADQAIPRSVRNIAWGWGVVAGDFDNDRDQDIVATNGWPGWENLSTRYWANNGAGLFSDQPVSVGLYFNVNGRGLVTLDHDKDGDLDLLFIDNQGPARFYRNNLVIEDGFTNYLRVKLDTSNHPCLAPDGYGAKITAIVSGQSQLHATHNNASYLSQSEITTHIGMAEHTTVDELRIDWADGNTTTLYNIPANQEITVQAFHKADINQDGHFNYFDASLLLSHYRAQAQAADFNDDGQINYDDITAFLESFNNACE